MSKHFRNREEMLKELRACYRMFKYQVFFDTYIVKPNWPGFHEFFLWNLVDLLCLFLSLGFALSFMVIIFMSLSFCPLIMQVILGTITVFFFCLHILANRNCYKFYYKMVETGFFNDMV